MKKFKNITYYNLFVTSDETAWKNDENTYIIPPDRMLDYTNKAIKDMVTPFTPQMEDYIKELPCLFLYENGMRDYGYIGYLTKLSIRTGGAKINYVLVQKISMEIIKSHMFELDISSLGYTELSRTHWAIKNVDLLKNIPLNEPSASNKPKVFISYSWEFEQTKQRVADLVERLENKNIDVAYDKKSLRLGNDMNYFMESLQGYDKVLVICDSSYAKKANSRDGGVGTESEIIIPEIKNNPLQNKIIPIFFEKNERNMPIVPTYLRDKFGVDLAGIFNESEFNRLLEDILSK